MTGSEYDHGGVWPGAENDPGNDEAVRSTGWVMGAVWVEGHPGPPKELPQIQRQMMGYR